jgi:outer membrane lipoprotein-sorting protein
MSLSFLWAQSDPKATNIMNTSKQKFGALKDISSSFKYSLENKNLKEGNLSRTGTIKMKGKKYRISFSEQEVICDAINIWVIMKSEKEVNISQYDPEESLSIDRLYKIYETETKARFDKDEIIGGNTYNKISLFALNKSTDYSRVELWVNKKNSFIERAAIFQKNGAIIRYELTNLKTDAGIPDTEFVFSKASWPGYEVIDLR